MSPTSYQTAPPRGEADNLSLHQPLSISLPGRAPLRTGTEGPDRSRPRVGYFEADVVVDVVEVVEVVEVEAAVAPVSCCTCWR